VLWEYLLPHVHNSFATVLVRSLNQQVGVLIHDRFLISQRLLRGSAGEVSLETLSGWPERLYCVGVPSYLIRWSSTSSGSCIMLSTLLWVGVNCNGLFGSWVLCCGGLP
jgi:hypothetical protein